MRNLLNAADKYVFNRTVFKILMIIATMATSVPFIHTEIGGYIKFILVFGVVVILTELITGRLFAVLKDKVNWLLIGFLISYVVTIVINRQYSFSENAKSLIYMGEFFVLFAMMRPDRTKESLTKEIKIISGVIIACTAVLSLASFMTFALGINGRYLGNNGYVYYGMNENRLWGVFNANTGSTLNAISIILSVGFVLSAKKKVLTYVLNILNLILQSICLVLTGSRAANYVTYLVVAVLIFIEFYKYCLNNGGKKLVFGIGKSVIAAVLSVAVLFGTFAVIRSTVVYLPSKISAYTNWGDTAQNFINNAINGGEDENSDNSADVESSEETEDPENNEIPEKIDLTRLEELENREGGLFTGRIDIWKACFKVFKNNPIFGVGRENLYIHAKDLLTETWKYHFYKGGTHNIYICILVSSGIVGFLIMAAFAVITLWSAISSLIRKFKDYNIWAVISMLLVVMFYITEFVEARILYQVNIFYVLFWIYCGYMFAFAKLYKKEAVSEGKNETGELSE